MGRPRKEFKGESLDALIDMIASGVPAKDICADLDVSAPTLSKRIAELQRDEGVILQYRSLQSLELTRLQAKVLAAITDEKIEEASLKDLVLAFKILKEKDATSEDPKELRGLVGYLIEIEKREAAAKTPTSLHGDLANAEDAEVVTRTTIKAIGFKEGEEVPQL